MAGCKALKWGGRKLWGQNISSAGRNILPKRVALRNCSGYYSLRQGALPAFAAAGAVLGRGRAAAACVTGCPLCRRSIWALAA
ncbi:hypothetical protein DPQ22_08630 [Candidatus Tokpelaia sp.]|nr:hypothetical protein DPQ22_08630 [Candidatus Tokpelaia sp.]